MSYTRMTSTGHVASDALWLELHFQVAGAEDKEAQVFVVILGRVLA
jgi:hypothetical protein